MKFKLQHTDTLTRARTGEITTEHGTIQTPIFMPVDTLDAVKAVHMHELESYINAQIILGNTYHLYLRPGTSVLEQAGGLHKFNGWDKPILTDSGGYQVYSFAKIRITVIFGNKFRGLCGSQRRFLSDEQTWCHLPGKWGAELFGGIARFVG